MIKRIKIPKFDANAEEVTVTAWLRQEGDVLRKGDPLLEITTDKANIEMESPASGVLRKILAADKSMLPVGYVVALVGGAADPLPDVAAENARLLELHRPVRREPAPSGGRAPAGTPGLVRATPAARRLAREAGLALADIQKALQVDVVRESTVQEYLAKHSGAGGVKRDSE